MKKNNRKPKSKKPPKNKIKNSGDTASGSAFESAGGGGPKDVKPAKAVQKTSKPAKTGEGGGSNLFKTIALFLRQAKVELKKVKWPTRKELIASTVVVIVLTILVSFYLGLIDLGLIKIIKHVIG